MTIDNFLTANQTTLLQLLERDYGITGQLTALPGEHDANLRLTGEQFSTALHHALRRNGVALPRGVMLATSMGGRIVEEAWRRISHEASS